MPTPGIAAFPRMRRSSTNEGLSDPALSSSKEVRLRRRIQLEAGDFLGAPRGGRPEIQGAQPEKDAQSQQETIQNGGGRLALPGREQPEGEIPSMDQNPFGGSIRANCLSPFSGE